MEVELREIRQKEVDDALAYALQFGAKVPRERFLYRLSLTAWREHEIIGCALCWRGPRGNYFLDMYLSDPEADADIIRGLADRSLRKLRVHGVNKTRMRTQGQEEGDFWSAANWLDRLREQEATPVGKDILPDGTIEGAAKEAEADTEAEADSAATAEPLADESESVDATVETEAEPKAEPEAPAEAEPATQSADAA